MNCFKVFFSLSIISTSILLANQPGCWDCIGLTDTEIKQLVAYDDHIGPNCEAPNVSGYFGAEGWPSSDNEPDGPGTHAG